MPKEAQQLAVRCGAAVQYIPLIETKLIDTEVPDFDQYDWLIFTSRTSAEAFCRLTPHVTAKLAAVGDKTAELLAQHGYSIDFIPTVYSADVFVQEFPEVAGNARCLFVRGTLAKDTILSMPLNIDEWTVYDTVKKQDQASLLAKLEDVTVVFASPSAVAAYTEAGGDFRRIQAAAIGHITEKAILDAGGVVQFRPHKYTYSDVIHEIMKGSCSS